jgi:hypothetical protein
MTPGTPPAGDAEFDAAMARAGLQVPYELRAGTYQNYRQLRQLADLLHQPLSLEAEPATVFQMPTGPS